MKKLRRKGMTLIDKLVKDPNYIHRLGKSHRAPCLGCGRPVWTDRCRTCRKRLLHKLQKRQARLNKRRKP